ncbi:MAG: flavoprotein [Bacillota bacterium]
MVEVSRELIERIVRDVLNSLMADSFSINKEKKNITAVFTGGKIAYQKSLDQLKKIDSSFDVNWSFLFSDAAEKVLDKKEILSSLNADRENHEADFDCIDDTDLVLIPVMTRNTAAKLSAHFVDSQLLDYVFRAVMCGIPVAAVKNAADISGRDWREMGMNSTPEALVEHNEKQLERVKSFGIKIIDAADLYKEADSILTNGLKNESENSIKFDSENQRDSADINDGSLSNVNSAEAEEKTSVKFNKKVITYKDINPIQDTIKEIYVREDAVITPYAREVAENKGMILCSQPE